MSYFSRLHKILFLSLLGVFLVSATAARATNWVTWSTTVCRKSPLALIRMLADIKEFNQAWKQAEATLMVSQPYALKDFLNDPSSLYKDGHLLLNGKPAQFGKYDSKKYNNKLYAAKWTLPLKKGQKFLLRVPRQFAVVFHNGVMLDYYGDGELWGGKVDTYLNAQGNDEIIAVIVDVPRGNPGLWIRFYASPFGRKVATRANEVFGKGLNAVSVRMIDDLLYQLYRTVWADPKLIAEGFVGYYQYLSTLDKKSKDYANYYKAYYEHLSMAIKDCWLDMPLDFMQQIRKEAGEEAFWLPFWQENKVDSHTFYRYCSMLLDRGREKEILEFVTTFLNKIREQGGNSTYDYSTDSGKSFGGISSRTYSFISDTLYPQKNTTLGIALCDLLIKQNLKADEDLKKIEPTNKKARGRRPLIAKIKKMRDKLLWLNRVEGTGMFFSDNQMLLREFSSMLKNFKSGDKLALGRIFDFYRKNATTLTVVGNRAISMRLFMLDDLKTYPELLKSLQEFAVSYLKQQLPPKGKLLNVAALEKALSECYGLAEFTDARLQLMRENLDLCRLSTARHHALTALQSSDLDHRVQAMTTLMLIERELKLAPQARTPLPAELKSKRVALAGKRMSMGEVSRRLGGNDESAVSSRKKQKLTAASGPGKLLARYASESHDYTTTRSVSRLGNMAVVTGSYQAQASPVTAQDKSHKGWSYKFRGMQANRAFHSQAVAVPLGQGLAFLAPGESGSDVVALDEKGKRQWSSGDFSYAGGLEPLSVPAQVLGVNYVRAMRQINKTMAECGIAQIDIATGRLSNFIAIKSLPRGIGVSNLRQGQCLTVKGDRLYGWMPSGGVFCVNGRTRSLEWVWSVPGYSVKHNNECPAGFVHYIGGQVLAFLPGQQLMVSLDRDTGKLMWRWHLPELEAIHPSKKKDSNLLFVSLASRSGIPRRAVAEINPWKGGLNWILSATGVHEVGQGFAAEGKIFVPARDGIAVYSDAGTDQTGWLKMPGESVRFVDFNDGVWNVLTDEELMLFAGTGDYAVPSAKKAAASVSSIPAVEFDKNATFGDVTKFALEEIYPRTMPVKGSRNIWANNLKLYTSGIPGYFCERVSDNIAVFREPFYTKDGKYVPGGIVWEGTFPGLFMREGNKYLASFTQDRAEFYRVSDGALQLSYSPAFERGSSDRLYVESVGAQGGIGVVYLRNQYMAVFDLDAAKLLAVIEPGDNQILFGASDKYLLLRNKRSQKLSCYTIDKGKVSLKWKEKPQGDDFISINGDYLLMNKWRKLRLVNLKNGDDIEYKGNSDGSRYLSRSFIAGSNVYTASAASTSWKAFDIKSGKPLKGVDRIAICDDGVLILDGDKLWWQGAKKKIQLAVSDAQSLFYDSRKRGKYVYVALRKKQIMVFNQSDLKVFSEDKGELLYCRQLFDPRDDRAALWGARSLIVKSYDEFYCFGTPESGREGYEQILNAVEGGGDWPSQGWIGSMSKDQFSVLGKSDASGHELRYGQDALNYYLHVRVPQQDSGSDSRMLRIAAMVANYKPAFSLKWSIDSIGSQASVEPVMPISSWKTTDGNGHLDLYVRLSKKKFASILSSGNSVRFHTEIERYKSGGMIGSLRFGGVARIGAVYAVQDDMSFINCQRAHNYLLRKEIYEKSPGFFLQGQDLMNWLNTRRITEGVDGNIKFLLGALKRNAGFPCTVNIVSALWLEKLRKVCYPSGVLKVTQDELLKQAAEIASDLDKEAKAMGIGEACRKIGLTMVVPQNIGTFLKDDSSLTHWTLYANGKGVVGADLSAGDEFSPVSGIVGVSLLPVGAFADKKLPRKLDLYKMSNNSWGATVVACGLTMVTPGNVTPLVDHMGKAHNGAKLRSSGSSQLMTLSGQKVYVYSRKNDYAVELSAITFPEQKGGKDLSSEAILLALKNIPADSRNGSSLAEKYLSMTKDDPKAMKFEDVYSLLLHRTGENRNSVKAIADRMRRLYYEQMPVKERSWAKADLKLREFLSANKINLQQIRELFIRDHNLATEGGKWFSLRIPEGQTGNLQPQSPEQILNPLPGEYNTDNGKALKFVKGDGPQKVFREIKNDLVTQYFAIPIKTQKKAKAYFFVVPTPGHESEMPKLTAWLNGESVMEEPTFDEEKSMVYKSMRLSAGDNVLLIKIEGSRYDQLTFSVGDRYGAPIESLQFGPAK